MKLFSFFILLSALLFSCSDGSSEPNETGPTVFVFENKTDYNISKLYIKKGSEPSEEAGYGEEILQGNTLNDKAKFTYCPNLSAKSELYYITFVRQKGSTDHQFYISMEYALRLSDDSGLIEMDLLPYEFYYKSQKNYGNNACGEFE